MAAAELQTTGQNSSHFNFPELSCSDIYYYLLVYYSSFSHTEEDTITRELEETEFYTEDLSEHYENYRSTTEYLETLYEMEEALNNKLNTINIRLKIVE